ncbi:MAG: PTS sugar transporter subunit IIA [Verrucomicrobiota bacterium]
MSFRIYNLEEVAQYLHLTHTDVETLVKRQEIPFEKRGDRLVFRKQEIETWASQRILGFEARRLADYHQKSTHATRDLFASGAILPLMIKQEHIAPALAAKTRASVLRELVHLAQSTGLVMDERELLTSLEEREALCSTALPGGLAVPHPRHYQHYLFETSFMVVGRTLQGIFFGAPDNQPTDLFFLICCQDERFHLHSLARLCLVAQKTELLTQLRDAPDAEAMHACLLAYEVEALNGKR